MTRIIGQRFGHLAHICLNRPEQQNQFTMEMLSEIGRLRAQAEDDPDIRCVLLTGAGADFCAGGDVADIVRSGRKARTRLVRRRSIPWA